MDNSRKIIITLIILVVVLVIALTGAIIYIILQGNNNTNVPTTNNNINNIDDTNIYTNDIQDDDMTDEAEELARETFNSQFTSYEGNNLNSAQIRSLFSVIEASNLSNTEHQVTIDNTGITSEEELTDTIILRPNNLYVDFSLNRDDLLKYRQYLFSKGICNLLKDNPYLENLNNLKKDKK